MQKKENEVKKGLRSGRRKKYLKRRKKRKKKQNLKSMERGRREMNLKRWRKKNLRKDGRGREERILKGWRRKRRNNFERMEGRKQKIEFEIGGEEGEGTRI